MPPPPAVLLLAGDSPDVAEAQEALVDAGHRVLRAPDPTAALGHLVDEPVGLLVVAGDALSPFAERVLREWREQDPLLEVIGLADGAGDADTVLVRMDCRRILDTPVDPAALAAAAHDALSSRTVRAGLVRGDEPFAALVFRSIHSLVAAVEKKDIYTGGRSHRVALFAGLLADELGRADIERIRTAARIMDVGKAGVSDAVLNKAERLDEEEFEQVKRHPVISWEMLRHLFRDGVVLNVARHHHERWDGTGYPDGLEGPDIPPEARLVAVADSLDAITSTRAFRQARLWSDAIQEVANGCGTRYDPAVVDALVRAQDRLLVGA